MKTIEERAREYEILHIGHGKDFCVEDFILGAQSEHDELTRWHDPNDYPTDDRYVLLKLRDKITNKFEYNVGYYKAHQWTVNNFGIIFFWYEVIGWREIHE